MRPSVQLDVFMLLAFAAAPLAAVGCTTLAAPCGAGREVTSDGDRYCVVELPGVIVVGFDCPADMPYRVVLEGAVVCSDQPIDRDMLPPEVCGVVAGGCPERIIPPPPGAGRWMELPALPEVRTGTGCAIREGRASVFGGATGSPPSSVHVGEPLVLEGGVWTPLGTGPPSRRGGAVFLATPDGWLVSGGTGPAGAEPESYFLSDPLAAWADVSAGAPQRRAAAAAAFALGVVFVFGGAESETTMVWADGATFTSVSSWAPLPTEGAPTARAWAAAAASEDGRVLVFGGRGPTGSTLGDGAIYDVISRRWTIASADGAPSPRSSALAGWTGSEWIVWGGLSATGIPLTSGARLDGRTGRWSAITTDGAPSARVEASGVVVSGALVVYGGAAGGVPRGDGASYDPRTERWTPLATVGAPPPRTEHCAASDGDTMVVVGGRFGASFADDAWEWRP